MAVHTASTLEVQHRPHSELEFGGHSEINITTGFGSNSKSASFNIVGEWVCSMRGVALDYGGV